MGTRHAWPGSHTYVLGAWKGPEAPHRGASGTTFFVVKTPKAIFKSAKKDELSLRANHKKGLNFCLNFFIKNNFPYFTYFKRRERETLGLRRH